MIRDITIGQYYPANSKLHRLDPRVKIMCTLFYLISLFLFKSVLGYAIATVFLAAVIRISKVPLKFILKGLKPIIMLLMITVVFNLFLTKGGDVLFEAWIFQVTEEGLRTAVYMAVRLIYLIIGSSLMTFTTTPNALTDGIEKLLWPFNKIKMPVHEIAMMMSIALRFIPILLEETDKIMKAQIARGADLESGNIIQKAIRELRSCYTQLLDRIEERLVDSLGLQSYEYNEYVSEIQKKLRGVKVYLLTEKQKEFYHHVMTEYENRTLWYQSICYTVLEHRLDSLRDEQEDKLVDDLIYLFRECEKYADISRKTDDINKDEAYSFDMVTNRGINLRTQTYILPEKDKLRAVKLEEKINQILSGDNNIDVCTLLAVLNKKINK